MLKRFISGLGFWGAMSAMSMAMGGQVLETAASPVSDGKSASEKTTKNKKIRSTQSLPMVVTESKRNSHGQLTYMHRRKGFLNQEEKRRKLRSNPHFANSKKCTTKRK